MDARESRDDLALLRFCTLNFGERDDLREALRFERRHEGGAVLDTMVHQYLSNTGGNLVFLKGFAEFCAEIGITVCEIHEWIGRIRLRMEIDGTMIPANVVRNHVPTTYRRLRLGTNFWNGL